MNRQQTITLLLLTTGLLLFSSLPTRGAVPGKITLLLLDRVSLTELFTEAGPFLKEKLQTSAGALITTNTAGTRNPGNTHATLGAGAPALSDQAGGLALTLDENWMGVEADQLYQQLTGLPATGNVIMPRLPEAHRLNFAPTRAAVPCLLGTVLKENHLTTAVLGNSDPAPPPAGTTSAYYRFGPWLAANQQGQVDYGDVGPRTLQRAEGIIPWEANYRYLAEQYRILREKADFLLLELGDFARLDALNSYLYDRRIQEEKPRLFERLDQFLRTLWPLLDWDQDLLILLAPTPPQVNLKQGAYLTPCLFWGKAFPPGLLFSPTTRQPGLVANVDLAPTILHFFNLQTPAAVTGRLVSPLPGKDLSTLLGMEKKINTISLFRRKTLPVFVNTTAFLLLGLLLGAMALKKYARTGEIPFLTQTPLLSFVFFLSTLPLALHVASLLPLFSLWGFVGAVGGFALFFTFAGLRWKKRKSFGPWPLILPLVLFSLLLPSDLFADAPLTKTSVLGYDPMLGARYYGIGNELAGLFLGSILGILLWLGRQPKNKPFWSRADLLFFATVVLLALPGLGANFGAGLTAVAIALILFISQRPTVQWSRQLLIGLLVFVLFVAVLLVSDYLLGCPENQSHFGRLIQDYQKRGLIAIGQIVLRKLQVNLRLLSSRWTWLLLSSLFSFVLAALTDDHRSSRLLLRAALGGGLVGLLFNDSGLVFTAFFFYPLATTGLLTLLVGEEH
ncbi:MAG TPA: hypothetical protein GXZ98_03810 [Firmicutes bacterium]|jgi:hypothetical protein|nr:hypothetical protein [Bacillota bacterium]